MIHEARAAIGFALNEVGAFVWERLGEGLTLEVIAEKIVEAFEIDLAQARADLERFLVEGAGCLGTAP